MSNFFSKYFLGDKVIWIIVVFLSIISILAVYSSIGDLAYKYAGGNTTYYLFRHLKFLIGGFAVMYFIHRIPYKVFFSLSQLIIVVAILLLIFTLIMGVTRNEATRWLTMPGLGFEFQTSDIAKFGLIVYIARVLSMSQESEYKLNEAFLRIIVPVGLVCGLILPSNLSTAVLLFMTASVLMFIGRIDFKKLLYSFGILAVFLLVIIVFSMAMPQKFRVGTWSNRIERFFNDDTEDDYQANLAKVAIATSGVVGKGPGNSTVRYSLPQAYSDFIFAIIIEEWGSAMAFFILASYLILLYRAGMIVKKTKRTFAAFLAIGITMLLVFQALTNMAVAVGILPVTGQPLPLVSMGGTSLLITFGSLGILLSISRSLSEETQEEREIEEITVIN
ncbi:MAG: rod shape-determining protein RodA [Bacteroidetes bacterium]|nr:MAG: rod shape-determining protein RodA [Bacteroidota bacterium]